MLYSRKGKLIIGCSALATSLFTIYYFCTSGENFFHHHGWSHNVSNPSLKSFHFKDPHIFFVETSGSSILNARQACAVESTAFHNPSMEIYVLMTPTNAVQYGDDMMRRLTAIPNVHLLRISIEDITMNSPLAEWYREGKWRKSSWKVYHLSDGLRILLIWKYGGIYLDMDVITIRTLKHLRNCAITQNWNDLANGILIFDKRHKLIERCVFDFAEHYNPNAFSSNGPAILADNMKKFCNTSNIRSVSEANCDVDVLPPEAAFPIPWNRWREYFVPGTIKTITDVFRSSYMIHVWNKLSKDYNLNLGNNSLYEIAVQQHCPMVYSCLTDSGVL